MHTSTYSFCIGLPFRHLLYKGSFNAPDSTLKMRFVQERKFQRRARRGRVSARTSRVRVRLPVVRLRQIYNMYHICYYHYYCYYYYYYHYYYVLSTPSPPTLRAGKRRAARRLAVRAHTITMTIITIIVQCYIALHYITFCSIACREKIAAAAAPLRLRQT